MAIINVPSTPEMYRRLHLGWEPVDCMSSQGCQWDFVMLSDILTSDENFNSLLIYLDDVLVFGKCG